ncbi:hypothetical protein JVU11DRAFT_9717 [Chiua virens]|nr:hypothetical protein JVU11DRAFT_9717 [Chiua virens]
MCGTRQGVSVWDFELQEKTCHVEDEYYMGTTDVSPESTRIATGTREGPASVWDISTGEQLHKFDDTVKSNSVRFSPNGEKIAISECGGPIRIFDSRTGKKLITIEIKTPNFYAITPLAWTEDGQQIFAACNDKRVKLFDALTGTQLAESQRFDEVISIALAANEQFIAFHLESSISFLDASTLAVIGPIIPEEGETEIHSIALSADCAYLATGRVDGKIAVRNLNTVLKDFVGSISKKTGEQHGGDENEPSDLDASSTHHGSVPENGDDSIDLLEVEIPTNAPALAPTFDYDRAPSLQSSVHHRIDDVRSVEASHAMSPPSFAQQVNSPETHPEECLGTVDSPKGRQILARWLKKTRRIAEDRVNLPVCLADAPSPSRGNRREHISTMAAGQRAPRTVAAPPGEERYHLFMYYFRRKRGERPPARAPIVHHPQEDASRPAKPDNLNVQDSTKINKAAPPPPTNNMLAPRSSSVGALVSATGKRSLCMIGSDARLCK